MLVENGEKPNGGAPILIDEYKFEARKETPSAMELCNQLGKESKPVANQGLADRPPIEQLVDAGRATIKRTQCAPIPANVAQPAVRIG